MLANSASTALAAHLTRFGMTLESQPLVPGSLAREVSVSDVNDGKLDNIDLNAGRPSFFPSTKSL